MSARDDYRELLLDDYPTVDHWAACERAVNEIDRLRRALVYWNHDHPVTGEALRDEVAAILERNQDAAAHQPYNLADLVIAAVRASTDRCDQTLYDVIPDDGWGVQL